MAEKKKKTTSSLKDKMMKRKEDLKKRSAGGIIFPKGGTMRFRIRSAGEDEEFGVEIITFYFGAKLGGVMSPATFGEDCPIMEKYQKLKASKNEDDLEIAKMLQPKRKFIICADVYKDEKGKELDPEKLCKLIQIPRSCYNDIVDLWLDEDEWGDMTDVKEGYDIKLTRSGTGQMDTTYQIQPCQKKAFMDKKLAKSVDLEDMVKTQIPSYEELEEKLAEFLGDQGSFADDDDDDDTPKKKSKDKDKKKKKKSKYSKGKDI